MPQRKSFKSQFPFFFSSTSFVRISTTGEFEEDSKNQNIMHTVEGFEASNMAAQLNHLP